MKAARGKESTLKVILSLVILVAYLLPVTCKSVFVDPSGRLFVTSKENIIMALTFVAALFFEVEAMKRVIMIVSGILFLFLSVITIVDVFVGYTPELSGLLLLLVLHGSIFLFIYYREEVEAIPGFQRGEQPFRDDNLHSSPTIYCLETRHQRSIASLRSLNKTCVSLGYLKRYSSCFWLKGIVRRSPFRFQILPPNNARYVPSGTNDLLSSRPNIQPCVF
jgi:hypothetical protein